MSVDSTSATIFVREGALLPAGLALEMETFLPGWRAVQNLDGHGVSRKIASAHWNFFFLAGAIHATVLGRDRPATMRRAIKLILAKQPSRNYNALQIAKVVSKSFLGIPYVRVSAYSRHIQEGMYLVPVQDFRIRHAEVILPATVPAIALGHDERVHSQNVAATPHEATIANS